MSLCSLLMAAWSGVASGQGRTPAAAAEDPARADRIRDDALQSFQRGVNASLVFQYNRPITPRRQDWQQLRREGFDHVRLPINPREIGWTERGFPAPKFSDLHAVLRDATAAGLRVIVDSHFVPEDPVRAGIARGDREAEAALLAWNQRVLAELASYPADQVWLEPLNEPLIETAEWARIQLRMLRTLRQQDRDRPLVATGGKWSALAEAKRLDLRPLQQIGGIVLTVHFYDPFVFTHQTAPWTNTPAMLVEGLGFPGQRGQGRVRQGPAADEARQWVDDYLRRDVVREVRQHLADMAAWRGSAGLPVWIGETGAMMRPAAPQSAWKYLGLVLQTSRELNLPVTVWDWQSTEFGLFAPTSTGPVLRDPVGWSILTDAGRPMDVPRR